MQTDLWPPQCWLSCLWSRMWETQSLHHRCSCCRGAVGLQMCTYMIQQWSSNMNKCLISRISHSHYLRWFFSLLLWAEITVSWKIKCKKNTSDLPFSYFWSEPGRTAEVLKSVIEWTCCWNWSWAGFKLTDGQTALMQVDYCDSKVFTAFTAQTHTENLKQHQMKPISSISNLLLPQRIKAKWQAFILKFQSQATFAYPRSDLIESFSSNKDNYGKKWWAAEFHAALWNISKMKWDYLSAGVFSRFTDWNIHLCRRGATSLT